MANHRGGSGNFAEDRERASEAGPAVFCLWLLMNNFWRWNVNQLSA